MQSDLEALLRREQMRNDGARRGPEGRGRSNRGDMNDELVERLQHFRRMNHAELLLVREVLAQLQGQDPAPSNGATTRQIDQLTVAWKVTPTTKLESNCSICLESFESGQDVRTLPCFHTFHTKCAEDWLTQNKVCPICQFDIARGIQGSAYDGDQSSPTS